MQFINYGNWQGIILVLAACGIYTWLLLYGQNWLPKFRSGRISMLAKMLIVGSMGEIFAILLLQPWKSIFTTACLCQTERVLCNCSLAIQNWDNLMYNIIMLRVNNMPNGAHIFTYLTIPVLFFLTLLALKDVYKALSYAMAMAGLHELVWYAFYIYAWIDFIVMPPMGVMISAAGFLAICFTIAGVHIKRYGWQGIVGILVCLICYDLVWYAWGFKITLSMFAPSVWVGQYGVTRWYNDFSVNATETFGWFTVFAAAAYDVLRERSLLSANGRAHARRLESQSQSHD